MRLRRILSIILVILTLSATIFSSACLSGLGNQAVENRSKRKIETEASFISSGMFKYSEIPEGFPQESTDKGNYVLCGQTVEVLPKTVYLPAYFNNKPVTSLCLIGPNEGIWVPSNEVWCPTFDGVETLYFSHTVKLNSINEYMFEKIETMFFPSVKDGYLFFSNICLMQGGKCEKVFYAPGTYGNFVENYPDKIIEFNEHQFIYVTNKSAGNSSSEYATIFQKANTTYYFNYEESPNEDIFFINDFERGGKIENTPYEPTREGYKFKGWYKEPECVNAWDFEKDTLPAPEYYENGELKYVETCLYAKWEK